MVEIGGLKLTKSNLEAIPLIDKFSQWLTEEGKSDSTIETYRMVLTKFHEWLLRRDGKLGQLTKNDIQAYMVYLESENKSASTIEKIFVTISVFTRFLGKTEIVEGIQRKQKQKSKQIAPESLEVNERDNLLHEVKQDGNLRDIAIVYTLLHTGIRVSELCALNRSDVKINEHNGLVVILDAKGNKKRVVPLSKEVRYHLKKYIDSLNSTYEALFISNFNKRISTRAVQYMLKKYNANPHKLRHTFCKELVQEGINIAAVAELAGHSDVNITRRYSNLSVTDLEDAINRTFV
jgi:integrase/recombinase XerD